MLLEMNCKRKYAKIIQKDARNGTVIPTVFHKQVH